MAGSMRGAGRGSSDDLDTDTPGMPDSFALALLVVLPRIGDALRIGMKAVPAGIAVILVALALQAMLPGGPDEAREPPAAATPR